MNFAQLRVRDQQQGNSKWTGQQKAEQEQQVWTHQQSAAATNSRHSTHFSLANAELNFKKFMAKFMTPAALSETRTQS